MANWNDLKASIAEVIKTNKNQEITGQILQNTLAAIVNNLGENSTFVGIANPETNPGVPDGRIFYLASESGVYSNFDGIEIKDNEVAVLFWKNSWSKVVTGLIKTSQLNAVDVDSISNSTASSLSEFKEKYPENIKKESGETDNASQYIDIPLTTNSAIVKLKSLVEGGTIQVYIKAYKLGSVAGEVSTLIQRDTKAGKEYNFTFKNIQTYVKGVDFDELRITLLISTNFYGEFEVTDIRFTSIDAVLANTKIIETNLQDLQSKTFGDKVDIELQGNDANIVGYPNIPLTIGSKYLMALPTDLQHNNFEIPSAAILSIRGFDGSSYTNIFIVIDKEDSIPFSIEFTATTPFLSIYIRADKGTTVNMSLVNKDNDSISTNSIALKEAENSIRDVGNKLSELQADVAFPINNVEDWTSIYPDGFGRETEEDEPVTTDVDLPIYVDKVLFTVKKISSFVNINLNIRVNTSDSGSFTTIFSTGLYNDYDFEGEYLTKEVDILGALKEKNIDTSKITRLWLRFMVNSANFYGKFTLTELKYVTLNYLNNGKQDKEKGKSLSTNDFTNTYKEKLDSLQNYDDTEIKNRIKALEDLGLSQGEIENIITGYLDDHPELITGVPDNSLTWNKFTSETKKQIRNNVINVQDYGAKGDGVTDNYEVLKSIFENLTENDTVYFPHGVYLIDFQGDIPITEEDCQASDYTGIKRNPDCMTINVPNILVEGNNSQIKVAKTMFWVYHVFNITPTGTNFIIKNFELIGDYQQHVDTKFFYSDSLYYSHEFGYGIYVQGNGLIQNCKISMMIGDAVVTDNSSNYNDLIGSGSGGEITIDNCEFWYCRRQGVSILDSDIITIKNSYIHDIGDISSLGLVGKSPMGGIDIEPGSGTKHVIGLNIINSKIRNCPKSITNGDILAVNIDYINIVDSEIGTVNIGNRIFAKNVLFVNDSNAVRFTVHSESQFIGCNIINELAEGPNIIMVLPKMVKSSILDKGNIFPKISFPKGLIDCYINGVNISHEVEKGELINTVLDGCKLEHSDSSEYITFNGCTVKDLIPTDYITGTDTNHVFTATGLTFNKCLIINEPSYSNGTPVYLDTTKV